MAFSCEQTGSCVEPDPTGAGHVHLGPGVQIGEVRGRPGRSVERRRIGGQLDQVPRHEARRHTEVAKDLDQQPPGVATRPALGGECLFARLHALLEAHDIGDVATQPLIERDQEIDGWPAGALDPLEPLHQKRTPLLQLEIGSEISGQAVVVNEGNLLRRLFEKEVERVDHRHVGDQVDLERQLVGLFRENDPGEIIPEGVLLPIDEVGLGTNRQRVGHHRGSAVGRRTQAHDVRSDLDVAIEAIPCQMVDPYMDTHDGFPRTPHWLWPS